MVLYLFCQRTRRNINCSQEVRVYGLERATVGSLTCLQVFEAHPNNRMGVSTPAQTVYIPHTV
jgi:hypothetical protein